ncbi:hypothetical protein EDWATA_01066 [Edwardsiella tarda ATCC 23685]|uniref:Uncharacterized protein n=1 Tax=Edwardsiella tarda ATCC 23685 TaxID=500638 RepID=D4F2W5_EDWTA|nr:hypothetical protein EDWATA_01066 [Edwardsiella tarda ATCC 23685]
MAPFVFGLADGSIGTTAGANFGAVGDRIAGGLLLLIAPGAIDALTQCVADVVQGADHLFIVLRGVQAIGRHAFAIDAVQAGHQDQGGQQRQQVCA